MAIVEELLFEEDLGLKRVKSTNVVRKFADFTKLVNNYNRPIEVTKNGNPEMIVMNIKTFSAIMEMLEDYEDMASILDRKKNPSRYEFVKTMDYSNADLGEFAEMSLEELLDQ